MIIEYACAGTSSMIAIIAANPSPQERMQYLIHLTFQSSDRRSELFISLSRSRMEAQDHCGPVFSLDRHRVSERILTNLGSLRLFPGSSLRK